MVLVLAGLQYWHNCVGRHFRHGHRIRQGALIAWGRSNANVEGGSLEAHFHTGRGKKPSNGWGRMVVACCASSGTSSRVCCVPNVGVPVQVIFFCLGLCYGANTFFHAAKVRLGCRCARVQQLGVIAILLHRTQHQLACP